MVLAIACSHDYRYGHPVPVTDSNSTDQNLVALHESSPPQRTLHLTYLYRSDLQCIHTRQYFGIPKRNCMDAEAETNTEHTSSSKYPFTQRIIRYSDEAINFPVTWWNKTYGDLAVSCRSISTNFREWFQSLTSTSNRYRWKFVKIYSYENDYRSKSATRRVHNGFKTASQFHVRSVKGATGHAIEIPWVKAEFISEMRARMSKRILQDIEMNHLFSIGLKEWNRLQQLPQNHFSIS